ncbi:MAG: FtsX-like permease family protein, partial [Betaproteobacteria bacterium]|nr:FtsX-like permease family protein [Betaproteobacteria bacterium]
QQGLAATKLVQPGSLFSASYRVKLPPGASPEAAAKSITSRFREAGWEVRDRSNGAPGTRRFVERLGQFLSLVGLTALAIAGIGVGNGVTSWLEGKRTSIAIFKVLGADSRTIFQLYLAQILIVALVAIAAGLAAGALVPWAVVAFAGDALPVPPQLQAYPMPLALAALYGVLVALLFALAPLARARTVTVAHLFRTGVEGASRPSRAVMIACALLALGIAALAIASAREPMFAAGFVVSVLGLLLLLTLSACAITPAGQSSSVKEFRDCPDCPAMVVVPPGKFRMGFDGGEPERYEGPVRDVRIARKFALGKFEVTNGEYRRFVTATGHVSGKGCFALRDGTYQKLPGTDWSDPGYQRPIRDDEPVACV